MSAVYFAGVMVRLMLTLTPVVCILAAIGFSTTLDNYLDDKDEVIPREKSEAEPKKKKQPSKKESASRKEVYIHKVVDIWTMKPISSVFFVSWFVV